MIRVRHVIFSRVEAKYSPSNQTGYQIVYSSPGISSEDELVIKKRVQCFEYNNDLKLIRLQFFYTPGNLAAVVKTTPVESDVNIIDKEQRKGAFIAHAILLDSVNFEAAGNNPFVLFHEAADIFTSSPSQLVSYLKDTSPSDTIDVNLCPNFTINLELSLSKWNQLYEIAVSTPEVLMEQSRSIFFRSSHSQNIIDFMTGILLLVEPQYRKRCTFDTYIDQCEPKAGDFWVNAGTTSTNKGHLVIDLPACDLQSLLELASQQTTTYANWLRMMTKQADSAHILFEQACTAQKLASAFDNQHGLPQDSAIELTAPFFYKANKLIIDNHFTKGLEKQLSLGVIKQYLPHAQKYLPINSFLSAAAEENISPQLLADSIFQWLINEKSQVRGWKDILNFANETGSPLLQVLASFNTYKPIALIRNRINNIEGARCEGLEKLASQPDLESNVKMLLKQVLPHWLIVPKTIQVIANCCDEHILANLSDENFIDLVQSIVENDGSKELDSTFANRARKITNGKVRKNLSKIINQYSDIPNEFQKSV